MDATEKIADFIEYERVYWRNQETPQTDMPLCDFLAQRLIAAFPQLALEGREEWVRWYAPAYRSVDGVLVQYGIKGADREYAQRQVDQIAADEAAEFGPSRRNEWVVAERLESPWSEVQS